MTQQPPQDPTRGATPRLLVIADAITVYLTERQGTKIQGRDLAAAIQPSVDQALRAVNGVTVGATTVTVHDVQQAVRWLRLNFPRIPLESTHAGYTMSFAWRDVHEFLMLRLRIMDTMMLVTRRGALAPAQEVIAREPGMYTRHQQDALRRYGRILERANEDFEDLVVAFATDPDIGNGRSHP